MSATAGPSFPAKPLAPAAAVTLENCADEPIHVPGFIQPHGALIGFAPDSGKVLFTSDNLAQWLPGAAGSAARVSVADFLGQAASNTFRQALLLGAGEVVRHHVVDLPARPEARQPMPLEAVLHTYQGIGIAELELPGKPEGGRDWAELFSDTVDALRSADGVEHLVERVAHNVKAMTGFDRVMVYRFHSDDHGEVVADVHEPGMESLEGLHYPASDIPSQARELYRTNLVRFIADVDYEPVAVGPWPRQDGSREPLDMSHAMLRSVSPIHVLYLRNMGVKSSLTVSLLVDGRLWGLIACHHRTPTKLPLRLRRACSALSVCTGYMVSDNDQRQRVSATLSLLHAQTTIAGLFNEMQTPLSEVVERAAPLLLQLAGATGGAFWRKGRVMPFGRWLGPERGTQLVEWAQQALEQPREAAVTTEQVPIAPALAPYEMESACGAMAISLGAKGSSGLVWVRPEFQREVHWGGDPDKPVQVEREPDGRPRISPRSSFARWRTLVEGRCRPWTDSDRQAAHALLPLCQLLLLRESLALVSQSEGRFRDLVALQSDAFWQTDAHGRLVAVSKPVLWWQADALGARLTELLSAACDEASLLRLAGAFKGHQTFRALHLLGRSPLDQKPFELSLSGEPLKDSAGQLSGWHGTASDVTSEVALLDAVRLKELAELSSRAKSKLLSHVSHELRTPLNAVLGFSQLMMLEKDVSKEQLVRLKHIKAAGDWLLTMISDLLDLAQLEEGPLQLELTSVDAAAVLEEAVELVLPQAAAGQVRLNSVAAAAPVWIRANAKRLKQVLVNLASNAVKYNRKGGEVHFVIRAGAAPGWTRIEVRDTGAGLTPEQLTQLFRPFERLGWAGTNVTGTGIGLVITKELVKAMAGTLEFESEIGQGSCVTVSFANEPAPRAG